MLRKPPGELGIDAGLVIDWSVVATDHMKAASIESFATGDSSGLAALILLSVK